MPITPSANQRLSEFRVPEYEKVFVIGRHGAGPVTVYSQQVRALKLVWALGPENLGQENLLSPNGAVVVIGGGIAGVTAGAAAALHGAKVTILEQGEELLHLQRGCHTRYLHPRIYEWPRPNAQRADAGLPLLNWSVGTASEVADTILADYHRIRLHLEGLGNAGSLREVTNAREIRLDPLSGSVSWTSDLSSKADQNQAVLSARAVILALGFGVERTVEQLPRRSYWRVDSLSQTALDSEDDDYVIVVSGTGDGGIIDVLRAKLKNFDHGSSFDECVLRLGRDKNFIKLVNAADNEAREVQKRTEGIDKQNSSDRQQGDKIFQVDSEVSKLFHWRYCALEASAAPCIQQVDGLLNYTRPRTQVVWVDRTPFPLSLRSQPLNRLLAWRLWRLGHVDYRQGELQAVKLLKQGGAGGFRYEAMLASGQAIPAHQVVVRHGAESALERSFPEIYKNWNSEKAIQNACQAADFSTLREIKPAFEKIYAPVRRDKASQVSLLAEPEMRKIPSGDNGFFFRFTIWLKKDRGLGHINWVEYCCLRPEGVNRRRAMWIRKVMYTKDAKDEGQPFRHWINTRSDMIIRVRFSDGYEFETKLSRAVEEAISETDPPDKCRFMRECVKILQDNAERKAIEALSMEEE